MGGRETAGTDMETRGNYRGNERGIERGNAQKIKTRKVSGGLRTFFTPILWYKNILRQR